MKILDLGGIKEYKENDDIVTINIEGLSDIEHNLNTFPYPFDDGYFDEVRIFHVLEHLKSPLKVMEEAWRILKPNGTVKIKVPWWKNFSIFENPFHLHEFKENWFRNLTHDAGIYRVGDNINMKPFLPRLSFSVLKINRKRGKYKFWKVYELEVLLQKEEL